MLVASTTPPVSGAVARARMGVPGSSSVSGAVSVAAAAPRFFCFRSGVRRCPCGIYSSKARAAAELAEERGLRETAGSLRGVTAPGSYTGAGKETGHARSFINARTEEELLFHIRKEAEIGRLSSNVAAGLHEVYHSYRHATSSSSAPSVDCGSSKIVDHPSPRSQHVGNFLCSFVFFWTLAAQTFRTTETTFQHTEDDPRRTGNLFSCLFTARVLQSGDPNADEIILSNMAATFDRILLDVEDPFTFSPYHKAIRKPFDYYMFGQNYIRPLIDFRKSYIGNISIFYDLEEKLQQGHNVILISNHQSEADPAIIALLLEKTNPHISENLTFVAGDRVVTDPLCKPFSMGRNLVCVYSKKHMYDIPELAEMKRRANTRSLKEMALLLRTGGQIIWIAPSGGRDRPDPVTGEWYPAAFDASSVNNIRRLADHAGVPRHIHPLALLCYDIMPPPPQVEKRIGERRVVSFQGAGLSIGPQMDFREITVDCRNPEEAKVTFSEALYTSVCEQYRVLDSAIYGCQGLNASNSIVSLSQPWA